MFVKVNGVSGDPKKTVVDSTEEKFSFDSPFMTPESIHNVKVWIEG